MEKRKGLLERLFNKKEKKHSCCCDIQLEEVKDDELTEKQSEEISENKNKKNCCCDM